MVAFVPMYSADVGKMMSNYEDEANVMILREGNFNQRRNSHFGSCSA